MINLMLGDCLEKMKEIPDGLIIVPETSPPYDNMRTYGDDSNGWGPHIWKPCIKEIYRVLKSGRSLVWIVDNATVKNGETCTSFEQALFCRDLGFKVETMIWEKTGSGCVGSQKYYSHNFEYMFIFSKGAPLVTNLLKDRKNLVKPKVRTVNEKLKADGKAHSKRVIKTKTHGKRFDIWKQSPQQNSDHPAPFPLKLAEDHIKSWSNEGDLILDPFMGSGTTGAACGNLDRNFIGIELDENYFNIAEERILKAYGGDLLT